jgi:hypothetical protein
MSYATIIHAHLKVVIDKIILTVQERREICLHVQVVIKIYMFLTRGFGNLLKQAAHVLQYIIDCIQTVNRESR